MTDRLKTLAAAGLGFGTGALCVWLALGLGAGRAVPTADDFAAPASYADAVARAAPSVVRVFGQRLGPPPSPAPGPQQGVLPGLNRGSAVVVSDDGLLVTNGHLVAGADAIIVEAPGHGIQEAMLLGIDAATDLAVLRLPRAMGPSIAVGEPAQLRPGDVVLAIGNPFGLDQTVSFGIVSATRRSHLGLTEIEDFIQTDAAVNPGNSGGALIDSRGRLVGINTASLSESGRSEGIAFAIPADRALRVVQEIAATGSVARGWIGIGALTLDAALAERFGLRAEHGAFVTRVLEGSPAALAGVRAGDVIVEAAGRAVSSSPALLEAVSTAGDGAEITLGLMRGSEHLSTRVETRLRPSQSGTSAPRGAVAARGCANAAGGC